MKRIVLLCALAGVAYGQQPGDLVEVVRDTVPKDNTMFFGIDFREYKAAIAKASVAPADEVDAGEVRRDLNGNVSHRLADAKVNAANSALGDFPIRAHSLFRFVEYADNFGRVTRPSPRSSYYAVLQQGDRWAAVSTNDLRWIPTDKKAEAEKTLAAQIESWKQMEKEQGPKVAAFLKKAWAQHAAQQEAAAQEQEKKAQDRAVARSAQIQQAKATSDSWDRADAERYRMLRASGRCD